MSDLVATHCLKIELLGTPKLQASSDEGKLNELDQRTNKRDRQEAVVVLIYASAMHLVHDLSVSACLLSSLSKLCLQFVRYFLRSACIEHNF